MLYKSEVHWKGNILFTDAFNILYTQLYGVGGEVHWRKDVVNI